MERVLDVRGLSCPIPLVRARGELGSLAAGDVLVVRGSTAAPLRR